jgi:hypothetical protein
MSMKKLLAATAVAGILVAAPAQAFLLDWKFNPNGTGFGAAVTVNEYMDIVGPSYVNTTTPVAGAFTFAENGAIVSSTHDGGAAYTGFAGTEITALFNLTGAGTLGGTVTYNAGGLIDIFSDTTPDFATATAPGIIYGANDGTAIGSFLILGGGGAIDPTGIPNGQQTIVAQATSLTAGYWFDAAGTDLSTLVGSGLVFGFATTNASYVGNPSAAVLSDIVAAQGGDLTFTNCLPGQVAPSVPCTGVTGQGEFVISNNGQFRLNVPEPGSLALLGLALLGMAGFSRRKS